MGEMSLYTGIEDMLRPRIAERRSVLVQKIHQLFGDLSGNSRKNRLRGCYRDNAREYFLLKPIILIFNKY